MAQWVLTLSKMMELGLKKKKFETTTGKVSKRMRKFRNDDVEDNVTNYH